MTNNMIKLAAVLGVIGAPVAAQDMVACDDEGMSKVIEQVEAASEETKEQAMAELQMAKDKIAEGDAEACTLHLNNASKAASGA